MKNLTNYFALTLKRCMKCNVILGKKHKSNYCDTCKIKDKHYKNKQIQINEKGVKNENKKTTR